MDINTVILGLSVGSYLFGVLLILYQFQKEPSHKIPFLIGAKFLQGTGSLVLYCYDARSASVAGAAGIGLLLLGCSYECWAVFRITGRSVRRPLHFSVSVSIVAACGLIFYLAQPYRQAVTFFIHTPFYILPGWALLSRKGNRSLLGTVLGGTFLLVALIFCIRSLWLLFAPETSQLLFGAVLSQIMLPIVYCMMLISGFSLLLLAKENTDRELQESFLEQQAILDTLPTGLGILRDRLIIRCNPALEQTFGFAPGTLVGKHVRWLYTSDEECELYGQMVYEEIKRNSRFQGEILTQRHDGERFWSWVEGTSIFPERSGRHAVFSITDITLQKQQQELLSRQKEELEAALQANNCFIAMISHEYRTPLAIIRGNLDLLALLEDRDGNIVFAVGKMKSAVARLVEILEVSLGRVKLANDTLKLHPEPLAVADVCAAALKQATEFWPDRHFDTSSSEASATVSGDAVLLKTAILNLLDNAVKYSPPQTPVSLEWRSAENEAIITASDQGPGVTSEELEQLGEKYYRGSASSGTVGAGIGLWLVARIVEEHRGSLRFKSDAPGLSVEIRLPLSTQERDHE
jgi:PAS domain S-box-containing protein